MAKQRRKRKENVGTNQGIVLSVSSNEKTESHPICCICFLNLTKVYYQSIFLTLLPGNH